MNAEGFVIPCSEAGIDPDRCLEGCGACEIASGHHEKFVAFLKQKGIPFYPPVSSEDELRTTAVLKPRQLTILLHRDGMNGGGIGGEIIFKCYVGDSRLESGEVQALLLESS